MRLAAQGVGVVVGGRAVLSGVDLDVEGGVCLAVAGPSGSGKTTLLSVLAGDLAPDRGAVLVDGRPLRRGDRAHVARTGRVLQLHALVPVLTASENVELALRARGWSGRRATAEAASALERVGLADVAGRPAGRLSGGQRQRVGVARALASGPDLLLLDEPTSELDEATREVVVGTLVQEAARGAAVVLATHDPAVVAACDRRLGLGERRVLPG